MLLFNLPREKVPGFLRGEPATVKINGVPRELTFDAKAEAVKFTSDEGPQVRKFLGATEDGSLVRFAFTGADGSGSLTGPDESGKIITVTAK